MKKTFFLSFLLTLCCFLLSNGLNAQSASYSTFSLWLQTEPGMQSELSIAAIKPKLKANDQYLWADPVKIVFIKGTGYILNGHHRVQAAVEIKWTGKIPYQNIPEADISKHSGFKDAKEVVATAHGY